MSYEAEPLRVAVGTIQAAAIFRDDLGRALDIFGIRSLTDWLVLNQLASNGGSSINLEDIVPDGVSRANASEITSRLYRRGLVDKDLDPTNQRFKLISITEAGQEFKEAAAPGLKDTAEFLLRGLSQEEIQFLGQTTTKLIERAGHVIWLPSEN